MSVPDAFPRFEEMSAAFKEKDPLEIADMYKFYSEALAISSSDVEPRSLQQYCRTRARMSFWKAKRWIPESTKNCGLPPKPQSYLSLKI
ncbi:hypothetical protein AVEN_31729-1 [Araneus ventricosus]|uniref:Uncharacterized protein n=1 Tax=Araneus ventricosus TaxID=182803 RepID=A0A4Y2U0N5_ARAVE|nr:hypothetical protein AVEN_31729-1 [Araneus ventricosus]